MRNAAVLCATWTALVLILTARAYFAAPGFETALSQPCPILLNQLVPSVERSLQAWHSSWQLPIVVWVEGRSGKEITSFRPGALIMTCDSLEQRASLQLEEKRSGASNPRLHIMTGHLLGLILVPSAVIFAIGILLGARPK